MQSSSPKKLKLQITHVLTAVAILIFVLISGFLHILTLTSQPSGRTTLGSSSHDSTKSLPSNNSYHFLISSDCTSYQRWEVLTQLHSAQQIHQCGRYTWIVSGCLDDSQAETGRGRGGAQSDVLTYSLLLEETRRHFHVTLTNETIQDDVGEVEEDDCSTIHLYVHFTPNYTNMSIYGGPYADGKFKRSFVNRKGKVQRGNFGNTYPFNNKPNGLHHWIVDYLRRDKRRDEAVVLIDPDFLFLNKLEVEEVVLPGKPAAAKYGLGGQFLDFNLTRICDRAPMTKDGSKKTIPCPFVNVTNRDVNKYYSAGPPYIIHIEDVLLLSERWSALVPPTYDEYPLLYAEMFAYSMAAADLNLKHNLIKGLFAGCMTGWPHTHDKQDHDALQLSAKTYADLIEEDPLGIEATNGGVPSCFLSPLSPPPFLHYCSRYSFATPFRDSNQNAAKSYHWFAKRHVDHNILDCKEDYEPLQPYLSDKPEKAEGGDTDWNVLAVCAIVKAINFAKRASCDENAS